MAATVFYFNKGGGSDSDSWLKLVLDDYDCTKIQSFRKKQFSDNSNKAHVDDETLGEHCGVFNWASFSLGEEAFLTALMDTSIIMDPQNGPGPGTVRGSGNYSPNNTREKTHAPNSGGVA